jgi:hypothetical protein
MNSVEVTAIVKDLIVHYGLPFTLVSVNASDRRWDILVRSASGRTIPLSVHDGRPSDIRQTIQDKLEAEV